MDREKKKNKKKKNRPSQRLVLTEAQIPAHFSLSLSLSPFLPLRAWPRFAFLFSLGPTLSLLPRPSLARLPYSFSPFFPIFSSLGSVPLSFPFLWPSSMAQLSLSHFIK